MYACMHACMNACMYVRMYIYILYIYILRPNQSTHSVLAM